MWYKINNCFFSIKCFQNIGRCLDKCVGFSSSDFSIKEELGVSSFTRAKKWKTRKCLKAFILRARVLKLYRQSLRIARRAPGDSKDELRKEIRQEVEKNRDCNDKQRIRFLISEGLERLKSLDEMLDMQGH